MKNCTVFSILLILALSSNICYGQKFFQNRLSFSLETEGLLNKSNNTNLNVAEQTFYIDNGNEKSSISVGYKADFLVGLTLFNRRVEVNSGIGFYNFSHSMNIRSAGLKNRYKHLLIKTNYLEVPIRVKYYFARKPTVAGYLFAGASILADRIATKNDYLQPREIKTRKGARPDSPVYGEIFFNNQAFGAIIPEFGFGIEKHLKKHLNFYSEVNLNFGFKNLLNTSVLYYQVQNGVKVNADNSSSMSTGDALGLRIGAKYRF